MKNLKAVVILSLSTLTTTSVYAQNCDCTQNFEWVKQLLKRMMSALNML